MAAAGVLAAIAVTLFTAVGSPGRATSTPQVAGRTGGGHIDWVEFDRAQAESMATGGQLVFVDVTADWCFTCKINERLILDTPRWPAPSRSTASFP